MKLPNINFTAVEEVGKSIISHAKESSPALLVAVGTVGLVVGAVMSWKASKKTQEDIQETKEEIAEENNMEVEDVELEPKEVFKATWKTVVPVIAVEVISVACIIGGYTIKRHRMDAILTAATLSASTFKEYQESVAKTIGEKKEKEVKANAAKEQVDRKFDSMTSEDDIIVTGRGTQLFYDRTQNTLFYSDREYVGKCFNRLNDRLRTEMYISLRDYYDELGLPDTICSDELGWSVDDGYIEPDYEAVFTKDGRTCCAIEFFSKGPTGTYMSKYA